MFSLVFVLLVGCAGEGDLGEPIGVSSEYVVGGWRGDFDELYATVEIRSRRPSYGFCTGTLIAERLVLTAGHCVTETDDRGEVEITEARLLQVGAGYLSSSRHRDGEVVGVERVIIHDKFDGKFLKSRRGGDSAGVGKPHDLALLVLDAPIQMIEPIEILSHTLARQAMTQGTVGLVSGYGVFDFEKNLSGRLYVAEAIIDRIADTEIVTDGDFGDTCFGDSGGPLYIFHDGRLYLAGVVSRGRADVNVDCGAGGIYTFATVYGNWIYQQAQALLTPAEIEGGVLAQSAAWATGLEHGEGRRTALAGRSGCSVGVPHEGNAPCWLALIIGCMIARIGSRSKCA